jgi:import inner membrane translocase subunit TIM16
MRFLLGFLHTFMQRIDTLQQFDHLVKANSPKPVPEGTSPAAAARLPQQHTSPYLLAKVVRARERLEAELVVEAEETLLGKQAAEGKTPPPPS